MSSSQYNVESNWCVPLLDLMLTDPDNLLLSVHLSAIWVQGIHQTPHPVGWQKPKMERA